MGYSFMHIEKLKEDKEIAESMDHNFRKIPVRNADPSKAELNNELIKLQDESYLAAYERIISESPVYKSTAPRHDAVRLLEFMLTYTGSTDSNLFDQEEWEKENVKWLTDQFGADNIISAVCHYDETTPHIHAIVIPMVDGRLSAYHYLTNKHSYRSLQDDYGEKMSRFGLKRGEKGSKVTHADVKRYYAALGKELSQELPQVEKDETAEEYRTRANEVYKDLRLQRLNEVLDERTKRTKSDNKAKNANKEISELKNQLAAAITEKERQTRLAAVNEKKAARLDNLLDGLKHGFLDEESAKNFEDTMKYIVACELQQKEETQSAVFDVSDASDDQR